MQLAASQEGLSSMGLVRYLVIIIIVCLFVVLFTYYILGRNL
jgi:hypothetical protein